MNWEFEHWDNGKVYLHNDRWKAFREDVEHNGYNGYKHDWNHNRIFCCIHSPRNKLKEISAIGEEKLKYKIDHVVEWTIVYDFFPAFLRTEEDPEGWLPSYHLWAEDGIHKKGEKLAILTTGDVFLKHPVFSTLSLSVVTNSFAKFQDKYWKISNLHEYGLGTNKPPPLPVKVKSFRPRSIFDD